MPPLSEETTYASALDALPGIAMYALHVPYSLYLAAKHRGWFLPAIANPRITIGGIAGESKADLYRELGTYARTYFAPLVCVGARASRADVRKALAGADIGYPLIAKPDIGRNGRGVRLVADEDALLAYLSRFPARACIVLQRYVPEEGEAGIFYVRKPSEETGRITSLTLKYFPTVVGDGRATLRELIERETRFLRARDIYLRRNARALEDVPEAGSVRRLASVGNYVRGAVFVDGARHITPALTAALDRIAKDIPDFHYGRFDARFARLADLEAGTGFVLIEYNGASSEPTHVYAPGKSLGAIYRDLLSHWRLAYEIGAEQRARGVRTIPLTTILHITRAEAALLKEYPDEE